MHLFSSASAELSIVRESAGVGLVGLADPGPGLRTLDPWKLNRFGAGPARNAKLSLVPPRNCDEQSLEGAILDLAAASRKEHVNPCVLLDRPACPAEPRYCIFGRALARPLTGSTKISSAPHSREKSISSPSTVTSTGFGGPHDPVKLATQSTRRFVGGHPFGEIHRGTLRECRRRADRLPPTREASVAAERVWQRHSPRSFVRPSGSRRIRKIRPQRIHPRIQRPPTWKRGYFVSLLKHLPPARNNRRLDTHFCCDVLIAPSLRSKNYDFDSSLQHRR